MNTYLLVYLIGFVVSFVVMATFDQTTPVGRDDFMNVTLISTFWPLSWAYALCVTLGRRTTR